MARDLSGDPAQVGSLDERFVEDQAGLRSPGRDDVKLLRVLTDRGSEYCGNPERHEYELYLAVEDIDHSRTKPKPQPNGLCERFHKTVLNKLYRITLQKGVSFDRRAAGRSRSVGSRIR